VKNQNSITALPSEHPDLFLTISEQWRNGKRGFSMNIHCPSQEIYSEQYDFVPFERDPGEYFEGFYQDIESLDLSTEAARIRAAELLEDKGAHLCDLLPSGLQQLLWKLRDSITSIFIQSDEPWIPWELCRPSGKVNDHYEEGKFWCESFAMTRWLRAVQHQSIKPALNLTLNCIATVIPDNPDLLYSIKEEDYLHSYNKGGRVVKSIPPTFQRLQIAMESGLYDGWHFSGHGIFNYSDPDHSEIRLRDGALKPENLSGRARNLGSKCRPLVFLNACQIGRGGKSLTGVGGWASRFLDAGAGAFIGPLWSVYDRPAYKFAEVLYAELFKGSNIGEAVKLARIAIKETGDPSWLAYSVFAYPMAKVSS
jgi:hypothetical protein